MQSKKEQGNSNSVAQGLSGLVRVDGHIIAGSANGYSSVDQPRIDRYSYNEATGKLARHAPVNKPFFEGVQNGLRDWFIKASDYINDYIYMSLGKTTVVSILRDCHPDDHATLFKAIVDSMDKQQEQLKDKAVKQAKAKADKARAQAVSNIKKLKESGMSEADILHLLNQDVAKLVDDKQ